MDLWNKLWATAQLAKIILNLRKEVGVLRTENAALREQARELEELLEKNFESDGEMHSGYQGNTPLH